MADVQKQIHLNVLHGLRLQSKINNLLARAGRKFLYYSDQIIHNLITKKYTSKVFTKYIKFFKKNSKIPSHFLYRKLKIHKGNVFVNKIVNKWMIGHSVGEFVLTRKPFFFPQKKSKKKIIRR